MTWDLVLSNNFLVVYQNTFNALNLLGEGEQKFNDRMIFFLMLEEFNLR